MTSSAFFRTAGYPWLYSGVTMTNPSASAIFAPHFRAGSLSYSFAMEGEIGLLKNGRGQSRRSMSSVSNSFCLHASPYAHWATFSPCLPSRVLPKMMNSFFMCLCLYLHVSILYASTFPYTYILPFLVRYYYCPLSHSAIACPSTRLHSLRTYENL